MNRTRLLVVATAIGALALSACSPSEPEADAPSPTASKTCTKDSLTTLSPGKLTIATGDPAYEPWVMNDDPASGEGFEAAVAYAAAAQLGYAHGDVTWVRTTFDGAIAPGPKTFDWNIQQFSISDERKKAVDLSTPYYDVTQAIVSYQGSPIEGATSVADLKSAKLGAALGSTSLDVAEEVIAPDKQVSTFNDNAAGVSALKNKQVDGLVVDLPTAFYLVQAEIDGGVIVGQVPVPEGQQAEQLGILLAKDSPLTACTSQAVDELSADGTLTHLEQKWLATEADAPMLAQ